MVDAGWFTDPESPSQLRWWNGERWTDHRQQPVVAPPPPALYQPHPPPETVAPRLVAAPPAIAYEQTPPPKSSGSQRVLVFVGIPVSLIVIVGMIVGGLYLAPAQGDPASAINTPSTGVPSPKPTASVIDQPGMTGTFTTHTVGGQTWTESKSFADETAHYAVEKMDPNCAPIAFGTPAYGDPREAGNPVTYYSNFVSPSGGTSMGGAVEAFPSADAVKDHLGGLGGLLGACEHGFPVADGTDSATEVQGSRGDFELYEWDQVVKTSAKSYTVHSIELVKDSLVARSWCYQIAGTTDSPKICAQWEQEVQAALRNSH